MDCWVYCLISQITNKIHKDKPQFINNKCYYDVETVSFNSISFHIFSIDSLIPSQLRPCLSYYFMKFQGINSIIFANVTDLCFVWNFRTFSFTWSKVSSTK